MVKKKKKMWFRNCMMHVKKSNVIKKTSVVLLQVLTCKHNYYNELSLAGIFFIFLTYLIICISDQGKKKKWNISVFVSFSMVEKFRVEQWTVWVAAAEESVYVDYLSVSRQ